jgi:EAL domain-containing protein (putative c-di-GMP-specific phosphodiesterase class I)
MTELLRRADIAMYQAKRAGSNVVCYDPSRDDASTDRLALLAELREALATGGQLTLAVQPAMDLVTGLATGAEALVRWDHPRRGWLMPEQFLPTVEQSELIGQFTRRVLRRALEIEASWRAAGLDIPIAVNLSARSLSDRTLPGDLRALLAAHEVPADRLILEITESVVLSELVVIDDVLAGLRDVGVQLSVDDFGTGYSSLTFLTRVAVDEVKIDRGFVAKMADSPEAAAIVRTTVELARELGMRAVAEGVETAEQRAALVAMGCPVAQGYLFFAPMAPDQAATAMAALRPANVRRLRGEDTG